MSAVAIEPEAIRERSQSQRVWRAFTRNRAALVGLAMSVIITLMSLAAPWLSQHDPLRQQARYRLDPPSQEYILGRDDFGRDIWSRILYAGRISLLVGVGSVVIGSSIGALIGLLAGYIGGKTEEFLMRSVDVLMAFPSLLLGLTVLAVLGSGVFKMILAIGVVMAPAFARVTHGATLTLKRAEFVTAARTIGASQLRIVGRHVLPNIVGEIVVLASLWTASAIRIEASLSFIGLGVSPPTPTWGNMIRDGTQHLTNAPWLSVFPGLAILLTVLAFNLLGDGLRDVLDPYLQEE